MTPPSSHDRVRSAIVDRMIAAFRSKVQAGFTPEAAARAVLDSTCAGPAAIAEFQLATHKG